MSAAPVSASMIKRARAQAIGLIIEWEDKNPLEETSAIIPGLRSHRNPVYKSAANHIYETYRQWIFEHQQFNWHVTVTLVFKDPNYDQQINEEVTLTARTKLNRINEHAEQHIAQIMQDLPQELPGAEYLTTRFRVECLSN